MSDFEINKLVAELSSVDCCVRVNFSGESIGGGAEKWLCRYEEGTKFDPCNNPADAWPIIAEHGIGIIPYKKGLAEAWNAANGLMSGTTKDGNPLRAAMIAFLKMKEPANVQDNQA